MKKRSKLVTAATLCMSRHFYDRGLIKSATAQAPAAAPAPSSIDKAAADRGQGIFSSSCSFCHGSQATGTEQAPNLLRSPTRLSGPQWRYSWAFPQAGPAHARHACVPYSPAAAGAGHRRVSAFAYPAGSRQKATGNRVAGGRSQSRGGLFQWRRKMQHLSFAHRRPGAYRIERSTARADDSLSDTAGKTLCR